MAIVLARVDNRLIHGQVLETWMPRMKATTVVVADDEVADDSLRQAIIEIAVPSRIKCVFLHLKALRPWLDAGNAEHEKVIILFSEIRQVVEAVKTGVVLACINIGNVHYEKGKRRITNSVSLSDEEICWLTELEENIQVDLRATPDDPMVSFSEALGQSGADSCPSPVTRLWDKWPLKLLKRKDEGCRP